MNAVSSQVTLPSKKAIEDILSSSHTQLLAPMLSWHALNDGGLARETVAREILDVHGDNALRRLKERADEAARIDDTLSAVQSST